VLPDDIDDRPVGHQAAALDFLPTYAVSPGRGVARPGIDDFRFFGSIGVHIKSETVIILD
jgi:hypothetical protein